MSFSAFAYGAGGFNWTRPDNIDDDDFVESTVASYLKTAGSFGSTDTQFLLKSASMALVKGVSDSPDKGVVKGVKSIARMESMHLLDLGVGFLSTRGSGGTIFLTCWRNQTLWPDKGATAHYSLDSDEPSGMQFFQQIKPALTTTGLNSWGVLLVLSVLINKYDNDVFGNPTTAPSFAPSLNITLRK
jgi:hypothetical protein